MINTFKKDSYEVKPVILERKMKFFLKDLRINTSPEVDEILIELFQAAETASVEILTRICQLIWKTKHWPTDWKCSIYIPIFRKGDAKECTNYRIITCPMQIK